MRFQDLLFAILGVLLLALLALHIEIAVLALVGAFGCGALYVFSGMLPAATESFGWRLFTSVFLALVLSCLVLILPGTFGPQMRHPAIERKALEIAALIPAMAACFEVLRTPRIAQALLRFLARRRSP